MTIPEGFNPTSEGNKEVAREFSETNNTLEIDGKSYVSTIRTRNKQRWSTDITNEEGKIYNSDGEVIITFSTGFDSSYNEYIDIYIRDNDSEKVWDAFDKKYEITDPYHLGEKLISSVDVDTTWSHDWEE